MIEKAITLTCDPARAFHLFTARISDWWPPERRHTSDPNSVIVLSETGRFFERDQSGKEVELGAVRAWEPPARLVLDWYPGTDAEHPTRVEVSFMAEGSSTRVIVQHSPTEASKDLFPTRAPRYQASWDMVLAAFAGALGALDNR
jgi:uncharacterized protein YndB with AHSA1/START domain